MTHKLTIKDKEYLLVGVPKDACDFDISQNRVDNNVNLYYSLKELNHFQRIEINLDYSTNKTYKIINTISNLTEEECEELVETATLEDVRNERRNATEEIKHYFENYLDEQVPYQTAKESFISLLKSKNILAKSFAEEPMLSNGDIDSVFEYKGIFKEYEKLPDELLLIQINN